MWLLYPSPVSPVDFSSVHELPVQPRGAIGFWLSGGSVVGDQLLDIRRQPAHAHLPVFVDCELSEGLRLLSDGVASSLEEAVELASEWRPAASRLPPAAQTPAIALARYLYLRPFAALSPVRDFRAHQAYRYPLAEALCDGPHSELLVDSLKEKGWLIQGHLVDRLRKCGGCHSTHLNYVDICPACRSLNIRPASFLHCFSCSHVAPRDRFLSGELLICPSCNARLRHIGVDYNRPLEQMTCLDCQASFSDAVVIAKCLSCDRSEAPDNLPVVSVASYTLSELGRQAARDGLEMHWHAGLVAGSAPASPDIFLGVADWMISLARRHDAAWFSLLGIRLGYRPAATRLASPDEARERMDAFFHVLREQIRDTDILTRIDEGLVWIGLPHTSKAGAEALLGKLRSLAAQPGLAGSGTVSIEGHVYSAADIPEGASTQRFLRTLGERIPWSLSC